ncbi:MAG: hypothetical protein ACI4C1_01630 [Lachnospiraceae bacterium]
MKKIAKGHYGYLSYKKKIEIVKMLVILLGIVILFVAGYMTTHTRKNLLTVAAVVSVLPLANLIVPFIALLPFKGRPREEYEEIRKIVGEGLLNVELVITAHDEKPFGVDYVYIHPDGIFCYSTQKNFKADALKKHLKTMIEGNDLHTPGIYTFQNYKKFERRLGALSPISREDCDEELLKIEGVVRALAI